MKKIPRGFPWFLVPLWIAAVSCAVPSYLAGSPSPSPSLTPSVTLTPIPSTTLTPSPSPTPTLTASPLPAQAARLIAYFYGENRNNHLADVPFSNITNLIYAFINVSKEGLCQSTDPAREDKNFAALREVKKQYPHLEVQVSVGGYGYSAHFSDAAASPASRKAFIQSCLALVTQNGLDGIDIDWETPVSGGMPGNVHRPEDNQNFGALLVELRGALDAQAKTDGKTYRLSAALPGVSYEVDKFEPQRFASSIDWVTVMAYAYYTSSSSLTHLNASLHPVGSDPDQRKNEINGSAAVEAYRTAGIPPEKIALGVPFYGRAWKNVPPQDQGLFQEAGGPFVDPAVPKGVWSSDGEITYAALEKHYLASWPRFWQPEAVQPWLYNPALQVMVTYDDPQSLGLKADYVRASRLGGIAIWQISGDDGQHSLLNALHTHLFP